MSTNVITSLKDALTQEDLQVVIDTVATRLIAQGKPCLEDGQCVYDNGEGLHCAVGLLMNAEELALAKATGSNGAGVNQVSAALNYIKNEPRYDANGNYSHHALVPREEGVRFGNVEFLRECQSIHDSVISENDWRHNVTLKLESLAKRHDLNDDKIWEAYNAVAA